MEHLKAAPNEFDDVFALELSVNPVIEERRVLSVKSEHIVHAKFYSSLSSMTTESDIRHLIPDDAEKFINEVCFLIKDNIILKILQIELKIISQTQKRFN